MENLLEKSIHELADLHFLCSCGKEHRVDIHDITVGHGVLPKIVEILKKFEVRHPYLLADKNTYALCGKTVQNHLTAAGQYELHSHIFSGDSVLIPDEKAVGAALLDMEPKDDLILAVGSGTLNDIARILSARTGVPYMIIGTAPSMDGYASTVSPLIIGGTKITKEAVYPIAVLADTSILREAPTQMMTAGYGDIIGKFTANTDWRLSQMLTGEYYCKESAALINEATQKCADNAEEFARRDEKAVGLVTEALILSGVAMGMVGNSRPASGAEHHLAHYWEINALKEHREHALHGNAVAVGTVVIASLYDLAEDLLPKELERPTASEIIALLKKCGAPTHPSEIGVEKGLFYQSILHAMEIRERYTILRFCQAKGKLSEFAEVLTKKFYP